MSVPVAMKVGTGVTVGPELGELVGVPVGKAAAVVGAGIVGAGLGELVGCPVGMGVGEPEGVSAGAALRRARKVHEPRRAVLPGEVRAVPCADFVALAGTRL